MISLGITHHRSRGSDHEGRVLEGNSSRFIEISNRGDDAFPTWPTPTINDRRVIKVGTMSFGYNARDIKFCDHRPGLITDIIPALLVAAPSNDRCEASF